jgi:hypothetical protein
VEEGAADGFGGLLDGKREVARRERKVARWERGVARQGGGGVPDGMGGCPNGKDVGDRRRVSEQRRRMKLAAWIMCACGMLGPLVLHPLPHQWSRLC